MKKEILIVSNYYPPEKGAAANRIEQLALKLAQKNYQVSVVCPLPNYPDGKIFKAYRGKFASTEIRNGVKVNRLWIYPSNSKNIFYRILSILSFSIGLFLFLVFKKTPKKVVVQSPPLLLSFISVFVLSLKRKKIILNVSDLWPLAAIELDALKLGSRSHRFSLFLESYIYKHSSLVLGQSEEIIAHIREKFPEKPCYLYRNFPDHEIAVSPPSNAEGNIKLFYAGLLGVAQGVASMCEKIDLPNEMELHVFGNGAAKLTSLP
ncbi:MAG: glycosyltransferase WbuB, partial [Flavobacterium sp.]